MSIKNICPSMCESECKRKNADIKLYDHNNAKVGLPFLNYLFDVELFEWDYHDTIVTGKMLSEFWTISNATYYEIAKGSYVHFSFEPNQTIKIKYADEADVNKYEKKQEETEWKNNQGWWNQEFVKELRVKINISGC